MKFLLWLVCVVGIEITGIISSLFAGDIAATYAQMDKPFLAPPGGIIGIVWTILYAFMGTALFLLIIPKVNPAFKKQAYIFFGIQQVLNFLWSIVFFGWNLYWVGTVVIVLLVLTVIVCMFLFARIDKRATYLFVPYLIWCLYAGYLTIGLTLLNS
ncbi:TspO/MBR family protein [Enterococcus gallinarum]|uniref:TspO/MBR family protein n=1 Tax=Enterococcus gallinarum TaxID=1353 RepID=UPI001C610033|nr:TspO/MBR family protein [Enterococcus gallinarum]MBW5473769.1 tryptophan-rich sensory protein [Enterococcus gallinarum]UJA22413.1 tryptophan-rich sensory protein [Enterococcus gallinarum]